MKRFFTLLLAALMLLACIPALSEEAPDAELVSEMGITLTMDLKYDIIDKIDNVMSISIGEVSSHVPYCCSMDVQYVALPKDVLAANTDEIQTTTDEAHRQELIFQYMAMFLDIAEVTVTEMTPEEYMAYAEWQPADIVGIQEIGAEGTYHWYFITLPIDGVIARYDELNAFGEDDAAANEAREKARSEIAFCQDQMLDYLKGTKLSTPVDPDAAYIGQVIQFETTDLDGNPVKSEDLFKDNEITMVNLWGTWCINCVNEMAELAEIHTRLQAKGCGIVGIEYEQKPIEEVADNARAIMADNGTNYPSVLMPADYPLLNDTLYYPTTYFVDRTGKILTFPISGAAVKEYEPTLDKLLAGEKVEAVTDTGTVANEGGEYHVYVYGPDGAPVEGALVQFCDDVTCSFQPTDERGVATFAVGEQKVYEIHMLSVPEGFKEDANVYKTLDTYSDVNVFLEKAE